MFEGNLKLQKEQIAEMLLSPRKCCVEVQCWGLRFRWDLRNGSLALEEPDFVMLQADGSEISLLEQPGEQELFLVRKTGWELYCYVPGNGNSVCRVPVKIAKVLEGAFYECGALQEIGFENPDVILEEGAFACCPKLSKIHVNGSGRYTVVCGLMKLGQYLFDQETKTILRYLAAREPGKNMVVYLNSEAEQIGAHAFSGVKEIQRMNLNQNLKRIGADAFAGCDRLWEENGWRGKLRADCYLEVEKGVGKTWKEWGEKLPYV